MAALTAKQDLDVASIATLDAAQENEPLFPTGGLRFLVGVVIGLGLLVAALGFVGVSWALLRMRNDDFDLAPRG